MRVSDNMMFDQSLENLNKNRSDMADLQNQAATQKRVTRPSDDPIAATRVLGSRVELKNIDQFKKDINYARSFLEFTDHSLAELTEHLARAKELAIYQANDGSANKTSRRIASIEVGQLYDQLVTIANRKLGNRFIFAGYKTTEAPFSHVGKYHGDAGEMLINVDKETFVSMNIPGEKIFEGKGLSKDGLTHSTSRQAMTAEELREQLENTNKAKRPLPFGHFKVDIRGPASEHNIFEISRKGEQHDVDSGVNLFSVMKKLEVAMNTNDKTGIQNVLEDLDKSIDQVVFARSQVGTRVNVLDKVSETLNHSLVDSNASISQLEDADIFNIVSEINKKESALQASLETSGKIMMPSLLDFLK